MKLYCSLSGRGVTPLHLHHVKPFYYNIVVNPITLLLHLLSPKRCVGCRKFGAYFCVDCLKNIKPVFHQKCVVCQRVFHGGATHGNCKKKYGLDGLLCLFKYQGAVKNAILKLKYQKLTDISSELADVINSNLQLLGENEDLDALEEFIYSKNPIVISVPLHWWKQAKRGFNQAEIIGEIIANEYDLPMLSNILQRKYRFSSQTKLTGKQRVKNAKDVYFVNQTYINSGKIDPVLENVLLIDDVATTGSTINESARALKRSGAKVIWGIAFAS